MGDVARLLRDLERANLEEAGLGDLLRRGARKLGGLFRGRDPERHMPPRLGPNARPPPEPDEPEADGPRDLESRTRAAFADAGIGRHRGPVGPGTAAFSPPSALRQAALKGNGAAQRRIDAHVDAAHANLMGEGYRLVDRESGATHLNYKHPEGHAVSIHRGTGIALHRNAWAARRAAKPAAKTARRPASEPSAKAKKPRAAQKRTRGWTPK